MSLYPRTRYEMTEADLERILDACKPVPYIIIGGHAPNSPQDNANAAWKELGSRMGFDAMTVQPEGSSNRTFTAIPAKHRCSAKAKRIKEVDRLRKVIVEAEAALAKLEQK